MNHLKWWIGLRDTLFGHKIPRRYKSIKKFKSRESLNRNTYVVLY